MSTGVPGRKLLHLGFSLFLTAFLTALTPRAAVRAWRTPGMKEAAPIAQLRASPPAQVLMVSMAPATSATAPAAAATTWAGGGRKVATIAIVPATEEMVLALLTTHLPAL